MDIIQAAAQAYAQTHAAIDPIISPAFDAIFKLHTSIGDYVYTFYTTQSRTILDMFHLVFKTGFDVLVWVAFGLTFLYAAVSLLLLMRARRAAADAKPAAADVPDKDLPFVTVQIPTYNELAALNCARRCLAFDYPAERFEIIIGDDSDRPEVSEEIDAFAHAHPGRIVVTRRGNNKGYKPGNLNHMLAVSKGEYLVVFDSDFLPEQGFLRGIIAPFLQDSRIAGVQGRWVMKNFSSNFVSVQASLIPAMTHHIILPFLSWTRCQAFIAGSAEAVRVKDLKALGGWRSGSLTEDIEYSFRLINSGKRIVYLPDLRCECEAPFTFKDLCKQQLRWAYGVTSAVKLHFGRIMSNRKLGMGERGNILIVSLGYAVTLLFFSLTLVGLLSLVTHRPEAVQWGLLISESLRNMALTSGFLLMSVATLFLVGKHKEIPRMIAGALTIGFALIFVVTTGILKSFFNRPMRWFMLKKQGNTAQA